MTSATSPTTCSRLSGSPHNELAAPGQGEVRRLRGLPRPGGKGNTALGAPNLTDKTWLHGWGEDAVMAMVNNGKTNVMPPPWPRS